MKDDYYKTSTRDSASYVRIVSQSNSDSKLYDVKEYYLNDKPKLVGKSSKEGYNVLEGECTTFFPSGMKKEIATYKNGSVTGDIYDYYPNGKLYAVKTYLASSIYSDCRYDDDYAIETCNDSIGNTLVINGNGHFLGFDDGFNKVRCEGMVVNKLKEGPWSGNFPANHAGTRIKRSGNDSVSFKENYINGKLVNGTCTDSLGKTYNYLVKEVQPAFTGGESAFGKFLQANIKYPKLAKENNIQGRVYINFVVEKDGTLSHLWVVRDPGSGLGDESLRVLNLSPPWTPGTQYGRPVRVSYTIPINFTLGSK